MRNWPDLTPWVLLALLLLLLAGCRTQTNYTPPGGPTLSGARPRLIVTADTVAQVRANVTGPYRSEFQAFLELLATKAGVPADSEAQWGPANYAFAQVVGVDEMRRAGFIYPAPFDTTGKDPAADVAGRLCEAAYRSATTDAQGQLSQFARVKQDGNPIQLNANAWASIPFMRGSQTAYFPPFVLAGDWCWTRWTDPQRKAWADAVWEHWREHWEGDDLLTASDQSGGNHMATSNGNSGRYDVFLAALVLWGVPEGILPLASQHTLYNAMHTLFFERWLWEVQHFQRGDRGAFNYEGNDYSSYAMMVAEPIDALALDTALGTRILELPYFARMNEALAASAYPNNMGRTDCGTGGTTKCSPLMVEWGDNTTTATIPYTPSAWGPLLLPGVAQFVGHTQDAATGRWFYDTVAAVNYGGAYYPADPGALDAFVGPNRWSTNVIFSFLFGMRGIVGQRPTARQTPLTYHMEILRQGSWTTDDSHIWLSLSRTKSGGHDSYENGTFTLHKQGNLIVHGPGTRAGNCVVTAQGAVGPNGIEINIIRNKVGIAGPQNPIGWSNDAAVPADPDWVGQGLYAGQVKGKLAAEPLASDGLWFAYRQYDQSPSWNKGTASVMQREFVYERGQTDGEYLVTLDRVRVSDAKYRPVWHVQVAAKPTAVDARTVVVTNSHGGQPPFGAASWSIAPTDGRVFIQAVLPEDARLAVVGDDGSHRLMYQDGTGTGTPLTGTYEGCTSQHDELFGWGRVQTTPTTVVAGDNTLLHILRFGRASTLTAMAPTQLLPTDPAWRVAWIGDPWRNRVVAFAATEEDGLSAAGLAYTAPQTTATATHLVVNLVPLTPYYLVISEGMRIDLARLPNGGRRLETDAAGVLTFDTTQPGRTTE